MAISCAVFFLVALRQCSSGRKESQSWRRRRRRSGWPAVWDDLSMVRSQLGAVQLSYCSENQNDKHHLKKTVGLWRVQRCPELFSPSTCGETAGWSSWHLLPRLRKEQAACEAKMADWSPRYDQLVLRYAENPWNLFPEIFQPWSLHPGLQLPRLHPQLQGLARPVAGLVPLPQNLAVPMFIGIIGPSNQNNSCQTFNSFLPSGFWAKSSVFRPVGFRPQSSCLFPGCGQGGQSDHPHDPRWHLFVGRSAQVGRPTNEMPTWVAMPKDAEISIYLSIYYLIYLFTLFVYLFNLLIN